LNRLTQPLRRWVEAEDVADLKDALLVLGEAGQDAGMLGLQSDGLLNENVFPGFDELAAELEVNRRRGNDDRAIDAFDERAVIGAEVIVGNAEGAGGLEPFRVELGHEQLDGQRLQDAEMVGSPAAYS